MPDAIAPNLVEIDASGKVTGAKFASFPGQGVVSKIRWVRADGSESGFVAIQEPLGGSGASGVSETDVFVQATRRAGDTDASKVVLIAHDDTASQQAALILTNQGPPAGSSYQGITAQIVDSGGNLSGALLLDSSGNSHWLQNPAGGALAIQAGSHTVSVPANASGATGSFLITLPIAWPNTHAVFVANAWPLGTWAGFGIQASSTSSNSQGAVAILNGATAQNANVFWLSIGW